MPRTFVESEGSVGFEREGGRRRRSVSIVRKGTSRSCRFACVTFGVYRYIFGRVLNRGFVNPTRIIRAIHCVRLCLALQIDRSEGSQRAPCGGESLVVRVDDYRSILDVYDAGREADSYRSILNAYDAGREAIWIYLGFHRRRVASYLTPDTTRRCESIIPSGCEQPALRLLAKG
jgi:hypothetical protein